MELDNLSIFRLVEELRPVLEGAHINNASDLAPRILKIKLHTKQGSKDLILAPNSFFVTNYSMQASHKKTNFSAAIKKELYNRRILAIEQHGMDRVFAIKFSDKTLVLELMGDGNKILVGADGKTISCERNEDWADRKTRRGFPYSCPKPRGFNPQKLTFQGLGELFKASKKDAIRELISGVNVPPEVAEASLAKAGVEKNSLASSIEKAKLEKIALALAEAYSPEKISALAKGMAVNKMLDDDFAKTFSSQPQALPSSGTRQPKKDRVSGLAFMKAQQAEASKKFEARAIESARKAELIYAHYSELEELCKAVLEGKARGFGEKEIMQKLSEAAEKGGKPAKLLRKVDLNKREIEVELE